MNLSYFSTPDHEVECLITPAGDLSKKIWAVWLSESEAFLNSRGDLIDIDETSSWRVIDDKGNNEG